MPNDAETPAPSVLRSTRPYGIWESPIRPSVLAQGLRFSDVAWDTVSDRLVWLEERSDRGVLVCSDLQGEAPRDLTAERSVRARVGYGGGDFTVAGGSTYFVSEGRLFRQDLAQGEARPITPGFGDLASPTVSPDGRWVLFVSSHERVDRLAVVDAEGRLWPQKLVEGDDFYMQPCWHPSGTRIAWIAWNHPQMPWDGTRLHLADLGVEGSLPAVRQDEVLAGGEDVSIFQPCFSPDGRFLAYASSETGWYQIYLYDLERRTRVQLTDGLVDHGRPAWRQGMRSFGFGRDGRVVYAVRNESGFHRLWAYDVERRAGQPVQGLEGYTALDQPTLSPTSGRLALIASSSQTPARVVVLEVGRGAVGAGSGGAPATSGAASSAVPAAVRIVRRSQPETLPAPELARPRALTWRSGDGAEVHGLYYPPTSTRYQSPGLPPAIVHVHGGPTSQALAGWSPRAQFFATRGFAFLEVNYRGSTGYGKAYMDALKGQWGVHDVDDAVSGGRYLAEQGLADGDRLVIMGGSAGGYTVLQALATHPGFFKAALCLFGVSNLFTLAAETHKFEERYLDSLLGPLPQAAAIYRERSPIFHAEKIRDPIALFQGEEDRVVPKSQAETIVASLRARHVPHEYHLYPGEGHGWRRQETIEAFYKAVEAFLRQYVVFA
ncbi:S9 family peptidase [Limnochorda pilosa]|uniref:Peptidase n=1 Tax=Limnochorda pilosa TaxID=1555112 RepID=A0A0K2SHF5_LIMPI|nr:S9 family peptidase [Limnochorda pilosa]BAS26548.1 peptidase [Limnochorda pilosa]